MRRKTSKVTQKAARAWALSTALLHQAHVLLRLVVFF